MPHIIKYGVKSWEYTCKGCKSLVGFKNHDITTRDLPSYEGERDSERVVRCPNCNAYTNVEKHIPSQAPPATDGPDSDHDL